MESGRLADLLLMSLPDHTNSFQFPTPQAVHCSTFTPPPLDGSSNILEAFDWHATHSSEHPLFVLSVGDTGVRRVSWGQAMTILDGAAKLFHRDLASSNVPRRSTVGILGNPGLFPLHYSDCPG
jgi:hypothetical protein